MTVGVVQREEGPAGASIADVLQAHDVDVVVDDPAAVLDESPDWVVTVDESALTTYVRAGGRGPVLALDCDAGVPALPFCEHASAVETVLADDRETESRRLLSVAVDGTTTGTVLFDAMLVTAEPARISEFTVATASETVASVRADGIVLATPAGSSGYAGDAGGAIVEPDTRVVSVVPVAPFVTNAAHWVLDDADITLTVEREEPVELVLDGTDWGPVAKNSAVNVTPADTCEFFVLPGRQRWHTQH